MSSELIQALDRLRDSVDSLRSTIEEAGRQNRVPTVETYLDDLQSLRDKGLIDEEAYTKKRNGFLDKL